ncbi:hypothetical protein M422DRAFT_248901, partial [Sphaerobolus stellatus SS14]
DPRTGNSFGKICADSHWERIDGILKATKGEVVLGGKTIRAEKYVEPTIVQNVSFEDSLMSQEIFGPILPIIPVKSIEIALEYIKQNDTPLALYVFSKDAKFRAYIKDNTLSGSFMENDVLLTGATPIIPFGGVGSSGCMFYLFI